MQRPYALPQASQARPPPGFPPAAFPVAALLDPDCPLEPALLARATAVSLAAVQLALQLDHALPQLFAHGDAGGSALAVGVASAAASVAGSAVATGGGGPCKSSGAGATT